MLNADERRIALEHYERTEDGYALRPQYDAFAIEDRIWLLPEVEQEGAVSSATVDALISAVKEEGLSGNEAALGPTVDAFLRDNPLSPASAAEVRAASEEIFRIGALKRLLAAAWVERKFEMGVVGFTLFFTFFNVLLSNLLAFLLAIALDSGIRSQKVLRSVFYHMLPALTGIDKWMGDPGKAPWLIVLVQVWQQAGYLIVIYLAGLSNIPTDVLEAASIDGARFGGRLRHITLPLLVPAFTISLFLSLSNSLKSFDLVYAMVGPSGYATEKAILLFLMIALITGIQLTVSKRREVQL